MKESEGTGRFRKVGQMPSEAKEVINRFFLFPLCSDTLTSGDLLTLEGLPPMVGQFLEMSTPHL